MGKIILCIAHYKHDYFVYVTDVVLLRHSGLFEVYKFDMDWLFMKCFVSMTTFIGLPVV